MRKGLSIGIGVATTALTVSMAAAVAAAPTGAAQASAATATVNRHITKAQARHIALAKVPHSRVIEIESDDLHNRPVWKVKLATRHGRVIVDVDKRTGKATIVRDGGGHGDAAGATALGQGRTAGDDQAAGQRHEMRGDDARDRDARDRGDRADHDHGKHDRDHRHDRNDDNSPAAR
jgi:Peptidase propeptide and YPEB domain